MWNEPQLGVHVFFLIGPEQFSNVPRQKWKFYILKMIFLSLDPHFSTLPYSDSHKILHGVNGHI